MKSARILATLFGLVLPVWLHATPFAYIGHDNGITVIDLESRTAVAQLAAGPMRAVAVDPSTNRAYAAGTNDLAVIDVRAQAILTSQALPTTGAVGITLDPRAPEALVIAGHCAPGQAGCPADMSTRIHSFNTYSLFFGGSFPDNATTDIAFTPGGVRLLILRLDSLVVLDNATRQVLSTIALGSGWASSVAVDPAGRFAYVAERGGASDANTVAVVDIEAGKVVARITVGTGPNRVVLDSAGTRLYVTNFTSNTLSVVDTATRAVVATVNVDPRPEGIDITPSGDRLVVVSGGSSSASIIDITSLRAIATVGVGPNARGYGRFIGGAAAPIFPDTLTGLWYNPAEPGWGVFVAQRGGKVFAAWFTYNAAGAPKWYVSSDCTLNNPPPPPLFTTEVTCSGNIYDTTGPPFFSAPFNAHAVSVNKLGIFQMGFTDRNTGAMSFVIGNAVKTMSLRRQIFRTGPIPGVDYTDLWWNPAESGWGIGITQQDGVMFLAWFAYDDTGTAVWYVASNCVVNATGDGCSGDLYRVNGPPDPLRNAFDPSRVNVTKVGTITASFSDANSGSLSYTVDGKSGSKTIMRQIF